MADVSYSVVLRCDRRDIGTIHMGVGCAEVQIGRSRQCHLRTPNGDNSVSSVHARLYWKGKSLYIEDAGSRNGVFIRGMRLKKPRKVVSGDMFAIGTCMLHCDADVKKSGRGATEWHRLEYLNGDNAGKQVDIRPNSETGVFSIGMDPGNSLSIPDMLVSRHHAEIAIKDNGECWLRDLGGRNGTYVNGEVLRGRERLLKDNDRVSIAYFDFRFLDKNVSHKRLFLWLKVISVAATLCIMAGVYVMWVTAGSTTEDYLRLARAQAAECKFELARSALTSARTVRDADRYRAQIEALAIQVDRWEQTATEWNRAKELLADGKLMAARKVLDPLTGGVIDAWLWNGTTAVDEKRNAEFAAKALRRYFKSGLEPLRGLEAEYSEHFESQTYLASLTNAIAISISKMERIGNGFAAVDSNIARLDNQNPDFARLANELDAVVKDSSLHGAVRAYADKYRQPCAELAEAKLFIGKEYEDINAMRFAAVLKRKNDLKLPKKELCAKHTQLSDKRLNLEKHHAKAQRLAENLEAMVNSLAEKGVVSGNCDAHLRHVLSIESWQNALTFDCFNEKPPSTRRRVPSGFYDELLGVDYTFQSLRALPDNYNELCLRLIGFSPDVVEARRALEYVNTFVKYIKERDAWLRRGELGVFLKDCEGLQKKREDLLAFLNSYSGSPRAKVIAGFYAGFFSSDFDLAKRRELSDSFKAIQREVSALSEKYSNTSDPIQQISLRAKILEIGFPGDAQLHSKWVQRYEGRTK